MTVIAFISSCCAQRYADSWRKPTKRSIIFRTFLAGIVPAVLLVAFGLGLSSSVGAQGSAIQVDDIRVEGLQRISPGTVFNYLPIKTGDRVTPVSTRDAISALFRTGFFKDVRIELEGRTLVVFVAERPSIASIDFTGNDQVDDDELKQSLDDVGFTVGRSFDRAVFERVEQQLRQTYFAAGKYGVRITSTVTPLERNRVGINFDIAEGEPARIKQINIVGNQVFDDDELLDDFNSDTGGFLSFFTKSDQYSKQKLGADLETLRSYYLDRGYINFNIESTQVSITPDREDVYVTINVSEGKQYRIREVKLAGDLVLEDEELFKLVTVKQGGVFSRKDVTETSSALTEQFGTEGYAFANVNAVPDIDEAEQLVDLTFFVDPGRRVYVRRINIKGNAKTKDEVLRREMRQVEGGWISTSAVERSKTRLDRLGYFEEVNVETPAVPGTEDQVDVDFTVVEAPSGSLLLGAGFSQGQGLIVSSSLVQENFMGTGHRVGLTFDNSDVNRNFGFSWLNPYFTLDGISLGFDAHFRKTDASDANISDYDLDQLGGSISFGIPVSEFNNVNFGIAVERTTFDVGTNASDEVLAFQREAGREFTTLTFNTSFANDTRNSRFFPTSGSFTRLSGEVSVPGVDLSYYKLNARHQHFVPIVTGLTGMLNVEIGYGDGLGDTEDLPLYTNFFAGGIRTVRGFEANTLGPRDSNNEPLGGSMKVLGNIELIVPAPFLKDDKTLRLAGFFDIGNVYGPDEDFEVDSLRYSAGFGATWLSPFGPLTLSFAQPLNTQPNDETQAVQFTFGTSF